LLMGIHRVPPLTPAQVATFEREGFLVLPACLDPGLCTAARDTMWSTLSARVPRLRRDDPSTWGPFTEDESVGPATGSPEFRCGGFRFYCHNGASDLMLDLFPRAMAGVFEQLLGAGEVTHPAGLNADGNMVGPAYISRGFQYSQAAHAGIAESDILGRVGVPSLKTETVTMAATASGSEIGQGARGMYCTMPNSPDILVDENGKHKSCHADGVCWDTRILLRASAFFDDCPAGCGGWTLWPRSHKPIWQGQWEALRRRNQERGHGHAASQLMEPDDPELTFRQYYLAKSVSFAPPHAAQRRVPASFRPFPLPPSPFPLTPYPLPLTLALGSMWVQQDWNGYTDRTMGEVKAAGEPLEVAGPSGTVVLWHSLLAHVGGQNTLPDVIRQAAIYDVHKVSANSFVRERHAPCPGRLHLLAAHLVALVCVQTPESLPDDTIIARGAASTGAPPGIWDEWSDEVRRSAAAAGTARL
jgi:hypothetical protein